MCGGVDEIYNVRIVFLLLSCCLRGFYDVKKLHINFRVVDLSLSGLNVAAKTAAISRKIYCS